MKINCFKTIPKKRKPTLIPFKSVVPTFFAPWTSFMQGNFSNDSFSKKLSSDRSMVGLQSLFLKKTLQWQTMQGKGFIYFKASLQ